MTDLTYIKTYTCPSNVFWSTNVKGSSKKIYTVSYSQKTGWSCQCEGFKYRGNCKHIKKVEKRRCGWNWEAYCGTIGEPDEGNLCPGCGEKVEILSIGV